MQDIDRNRTSLTSPAMEDVYNSELIYLLKNNETERYLTTYDPTAYSNEYSIVERMVVDKKRKFTDESMNLIDDRLNELYVPAEEDEKHEVAFDWLRYIKMRIPTEFPFYYFFDGIRTFFTLTDNPEELPNIDVVKYWKIIDGSRMYESFVGEWMEVKHNLPEFLASTLNGSHFTTVSHLLAEKYFRDNQWTIDLINAYVPNHRNELTVYDCNGKLPKEILSSNYPTDDMKRLFETRDNN